MEKWENIESCYIVMPLNHVDTDMIIPAQYLTSTSRTGYLEGLFKRLREKSADFPLNRYSPHERKILVTGSNFGCGSSREHAVWALREYGFSAIIAESFADIFRANALKNGLLTISLEKPLLLELQNSSSAENDILSVSLEDQRILRNGAFFADFEIEPFRKYCLLQGVDDLEYILEHKAEIDTFNASSADRRFYSSENIIPGKI
jgi:3-isopropylmalate/(R)-2-methylmalate dehydratase small subunit